MTKSMAMEISLPDVGNYYPLDGRKLILRPWKWYDDLLRQDPNQSVGAFVTIEIMHKASIIVSQ